MLACKSIMTVICTYILGPRYNEKPCHYKTSGLREDELLFLTPIKRYLQGEEPELSSPTVYSRGGTVTVPHHVHILN